jgi:hypothetical protein
MVRLRGMTHFHFDPKVWAEKKLLLSFEWLEGSCTSHGQGMVLIAGTADDAKSPYDLAISIQRYAAGENHDLAIV